MRSILRAGVGGSLAAVLCASSLVPPAIAATPPPNDNRADAIALRLPAALNGTLVDATKESGRDNSRCGDSAASVWYRFTAPRRGLIVVELDNAGEMDGSVDVVRRERSRLEYLDCEATNRAGVATLETDVTPGQEYYLRVGRDEGSVADAFALRVLIPKAPPRPPGRVLPNRGGRGVLERLVNPGDAWQRQLRQSVPTRMSLSSDFCNRVSIYRPGVKSFVRAEPVLSSRCGGYRLFTPDRTGRYVFLVEAARGRDSQPYRLRVAPARADDTAPGIPLGNRARVTGRLNGQLDSVDLYRFQVLQRSAVRLAVSGGDVEIDLRRDGGRRLDRGGEIEDNLRPGRYFVAVKGQGRYTLTRSARTITTSQVLFNDREKAFVAERENVRLDLRVSPAVNGRARLLLERRDPLAGWQFLRRERVRVVSGQARLTFVPPALGRYRVSGEFLGSRTITASETGYAKLVVREPLGQ